MNQELIVVKQLPIIEQQLKVASDSFKEKAEHALSLVVSEETVKSVKLTRADITKDYNELEELRKQIKKKILEPYEQFEGIYKDYITNVYLPTDKQLKEKINEVEDGLKEEKKSAVVEYYNECVSAANIDFLTFEKLNIPVTLSASLKSLKEQVQSAINKVTDDLGLIGTQEYKEEILVEYKESLNVSQVITSVVNRHKAIEAEKERIAQIKEREAQQAQAAQKVDENLSFAPPVKVEQEVVVEKVYETSLKIKATKSKLVALKEFLESGGYEFSTL